MDEILEKYRVRPAVVYKPVKFGKIKIVNEIGNESSVKVLKEFEQKLKKDDESRRKVNVAKDDQGERCGGSDGNDSEIETQSSP
jgi:hypothetical protein